MPTTAKGFRYPASSAAPNVPQDIQNLAADIDAAFTPGAVVLSLAANFTGENDGPGAWGTPRARLMPWGEVRLSGMVRRTSGVGAGINAEAGAQYAITGSLPMDLRPADGQNRLIGLASSSSGPAILYFRAADSVLTFSFLTTTPVYQSTDWNIALDSLSYWK